MSDGDPIVTIQWTEDEVDRIVSTVVNKRDVGKDVIITRHDLFPRLDGNVLTASFERGEEATCKVSRELRKWAFILNGNHTRAIIRHFL